jgi:hypothetical protein
MGYKDDTKLERKEISAQFLLVLRITPEIRGINYQLTTNHTGQSV